MFLVLPYPSTPTQTSLTLIIPVLCQLILAVPQSYIRRLFVYLPSPSYGFSVTVTKHSEKYWIVFSIWHTTYPSLRVLNISVIQIDKASKPRNWSLWWQNWGEWDHYFSYTPQKYAQFCHRRLQFRSLLALLIWMAEALMMERDGQVVCQIEKTVQYFSECLVMATRDPWLGMANRWTNDGCRTGGTAKTS